MKSQAARQFELYKNTAEAEVQELRRKLADISNEKDNVDNEEGPPSKRSRINDVDHQDGNDEETQVTSAAHRFVMLYSPWLRLGEATFKVDCDPEWDEAERFETVDNKIQGEIQGIKIVLGPQLSGEMSSEPWIAKAVSQPFE